MSKEYDIYLENHRENVAKGYKWLKEHVLPEMPIWEHPENLRQSHDLSKFSKEEYAAYDRFFYGCDSEYIPEKYIETQFKEAWLHHIHANPHHWQHWVLINDEPGEGIVALDMPVTYIAEMICDWWAFSWAKGDLMEIFTWYDEHKEHMILSETTRDVVEGILKEMKAKTEEQNEENSR